MSETYLLYVEDDPAASELVQHALRGEGVQAQLARSGEDGILALANAQFDLVITDYRLPRCSGLDVVRAAAAAGVPVIMLSGSDDLGVVVQAIRLGASDYLIKDDRNAYLDLLPTVVRRVLGIQRLEREKQAAEAALEAERHWSRLAIDRIHQGVSVFDAELRLQLCNRQFLAYCGYPAELGLRGTPLEALLRFNALRGDYGETVGEADIRRRLARALGADSFRYERRSGESMIQICREPLATGGFVVTYTDITERWHAEQRARHQAYHDALTGLPNRVLFHELLQHELAHAQRYAGGLALLFIDLDGFKAVNDVHGHRAGDAVLVAVATRLRQHVRASDVVARRSGDEFLALLTDATEPQACAVAEALIVALSLPYELDGGQAGVSASIGIAHYPEAGANEEALLRAADEAMYRAKAAGKGRYQSTTAFDAANPMVTTGS